MPILGLTDRGMAFPMIGKIRKGAKKKENENRPGEDLTYFRLDFDLNESASAELFKSIYGDQPQSINFHLPPSETLEDVASFWLEAYTAGRMVARSDGEIYHYLIDTKNNNVLVQNGELVDQKGKTYPYNPKEPSGYYTSQKTGKEMPIYCKPVGRIRIVIPELRRAAWLMFMTGSKYDCMNLSSEIATLTQMPYRISSIPLILTRKPREISCPDAKTGQKVRRTKWLVDIEINPAWFGQLLDHEKKTQFIENTDYKKLTPGVKAAGNKWDAIPLSEDLGEEEDDGDFTEGEIIPEKKHGSYPDLDQLSERDITTAFWQTANRARIEKEIATNILKECGGDFQKAYLAIKEHIPPN
jgi:hypothetical protein